MPYEEKLVASKANQLLIVIDETKLVQKLNQSFPLPVEVLHAWKQVKDLLTEMNGSSGGWLLKKLVQLSLTRAT